MADVAVAETIGSAFPTGRGGQPTVVALDRALPATRLLEKKRLMHQVQEALERQKVEAARKDEELTKREENLRIKDHELQDSLIRFSKFLQENNVKRIRAEKKAANETKIRLEKEAEIIRIETKITKLQQEKLSTKKALGRMMSYQKYLERVVNAASEYQEINDLLLRYTMLLSTDEELRTQVEECLHKMEELRANMQAYCKSSFTEIMNLENDVSLMKHEYNRIRQDTSEMEKKIETNLEIAAARTLVRGQTSMAIENIFTRICQKSKIYRPPFLIPLQQLDAIGHYISDTNQIIKAYKIGNQKLGPISMAVGIKSPLLAH